MHLTYRNVNEALCRLPREVIHWGTEENTRNGRAVSLHEPLILETVRPCERTIMIPERKSNALLMLLDGLSILSSVDAVKPFSDIVPRFLNYSDDGTTIRGHYGKRLSPQISAAIDMLINDPMSRRNTLQIWDHERDQGIISNDIPCNIHVNLRGVRRYERDQLDLTVFNRSNDVFWGMLGANIVQFSFLQEYLARMAGLDVGRLFQISTNAHVYLDMGPGKNPPLKNTIPQPNPTPLDPHALRSMLDMLFTVLSRQDGWQAVTREMFSGNMFMQNIVVPMIHAHYQSDPSILNTYPNNDWFMSMKIGKGWKL